jgi:hypothetical protein
MFELVKQSIQRGYLPIQVVVEKVGSGNKFYNNYNKSFIVDKSKSNHTITEKETNDDSNNTKAIPDNSKLPNNIREVIRREETTHRVATQQQPNRESTKQPKVLESERKESQRTSINDGRINESIKELFNMSSLKVTMDMMKAVMDFIRDNCRGNKAAMQTQLAEWLSKQSEYSEEVATWVLKCKWIHLVAEEISPLHKIANKTLKPIEEKKEITQTYESELLTKGAINLDKSILETFTQEELNYIRENYDNFKKICNHANHQKFLVKVMGFESRLDNLEVKKVVIDDESDFKEIVLDQLSDDELFKDIA